MRPSANRYLTPGLVALSAVLAIANWYMNPAAGRSSAIGLAFIAFLVVPLWLARRMESTRQGAADSLWNAVFFAGLMLSVALGGKLAHALGVIEDQELSRRLTMALVGAFLAAMGNALPKTLTPLSASACDGAKTQAVQRFHGWTWFMAGLTYAMVWLVMPLDVAKPLSVLVIVAAMVLVIRQLLRVWRVRRREA